MKITSYRCDVCDAPIILATGYESEVKGINIRIDLEHGQYDSFIFPHACAECRSSVAAAIKDWQSKHKVEIKH